MKAPGASDSGSKGTADEAAAWVLRHDRGLTPREQDAFSAWLAADRRNGEQLARHRRHWERLDRLSRWRPEHGEQPNPDLLAPPGRGYPRWPRVVLPLAAAAVIAFLLFRPADGNHPAPAASQPNPPEVAANGPRILPDGTVVELNRDAVITSNFTASERRVILVRGEAHFAVTKDAARPFLVRAGGVEVRAIGTAFNVRVDAAAVEVLVTAGKVGVERYGEPSSQSTAVRPASFLHLEARQRAVVDRAVETTTPRVDTLTVGEIARVLAWQHRLLDFNAAPLSEIVAEFNRRNVVQLVVVDPKLAATRISAAFRSDNIDGFVHLLEAGFGARVERRGETEIVLGRVSAAAKPN